MPDPAAALPAELLVNGERRVLRAGPDRSLLMTLREELGLTGAKPGCGEGACGSCTVLLDDVPVRACQVHLSEVGGRAVRTVEGLADGTRLHPVQRAFLDEGAFQCGYCTAGMVLASVALLEHEPDPDDRRIREVLNGNVCRCGTYPRILRAVHRAAELLAADATEHGPAAGSAEPGQGISLCAIDPRATDAWRPRRPWDLSSPAERDWFAVLPPGLVAVHEPPAPAFGWRTSDGAWLHVGEDGCATAFTGKVDVGQGNRTSLALVVAAELRVAPEAVRLVMGDTDLCPHDEGTFGSRSTPDAAPLLRAVATGARRALVEAAAVRLGVPADSLVAGAGQVRDPATGRAEAYGALVQGGRTVVRVIGDEPPLGGESRPAPRSARREIGPAVATGAYRFPSDLVLPGMRHGRVLRPPTPDARLLTLDVEAAAAMPGVMVVREDEFVGVVAASPMLTGRAVASMRATWDEPERPSTTEIEAWLRAHPQEGELGWGGPFHRETGDVEAALEVAPAYLSATYTTAFLAHVPLETRSALAAWGDDGRLTVWTGSQTPFSIREELAEGLGIREDQVRVIVPDSGGGFGGKHAGGVSLEAARLARAAGKPVKVRWSRHEEFTEGYLRPAAVVDIRSGAQGGEITAWEMRNINAGANGLVGPYRAAAQRLDYQPADSPLRQGAYRALAATANHFARESHMDELAAEMRVDAVELRLAHLSDERLAAVLRAAAERIGWGEPRQPGFGAGIACGTEKGSYVATAVEVELDQNRGLVIDRIVTVFDCGAVIDRDGLLNQVEGATVMGLGGALFEVVRFEDGAIVNGTFDAYRVPRAVDVPPVEVVLLDRPDEPSAGAGETPIIAVAPAIANAIFSAAGVRIRSMPLLPEGVVPG
jgi:CO/xanthine dehydrogenase Mo-binding subunit/aerobic-type carbon monoxide dehydrogenase small subunit (CoxS/CutS family)